MVGEWLLYNTAIPISPIGAVMLIKWLTPNSSPSLFAIIRDGQLCFYCTATIACLIRDIVKFQNGSGALVLGFLILLMIGSSIVYGVAVSNERHRSLDVKLGLVSILAAITTTALVCYVRKVGEML